MKKGTCVFLDVAISGDRNVVKKEAEKVLKYEYLAIEIQHMWNVQTKVILVTTGTTGTISESFTKYLSKVQNQGTAEYSHIGHCQHTAESTNIKEHNTQYGE